MPVLSIEELSEIVGEICFATVGLSVEFNSFGSERQLNDMAASIVISGAWRGVICLQVSARFMNSVASAMFNVDTAAVTENDRTDALCELTNMLGGSIKSLLPETCDLALPCIDKTPSVDDQANKEWYSFNCNNEPFSIAISSVATKQTRVA